MKFCMEYPLDEERLALVKVSIMEGETLSNTMSPS